MKLINSSVEEIAQESGLDGIYKQIAYGGHLCYKSEKVGGEKEFVDSLISRGHLSPLEHGTVYLIIPMYHHPYMSEHTYTFQLYEENPFSKVVCHKGFAYITTNYRVIIENGWEDNLSYLSEPTEHHKKRRSFHITCSRGIMDEFVRHRAFSFNCESTRYCNYSKDRFGNEITFIKPYWYDKADKYSQDFYNTACSDAEAYYFDFIEAGFKAQDARDCLPLGIKSEFLMTGFELDWKNFFALRCDKSAHPDAQKVANLIKEKI